MKIAPCSDLGKCGVGSYACQPCASMYHACCDFMWESAYGAISKRMCRAALDPHWEDVAMRLRACGTPLQMTVPCPEQRWGATMTPCGIFKKIGEDSHLALHGLRSALLSSRLVGLNDVAAKSLVNVNVATCGKHVKFTLLMPSQQEVHVPPAQVEARDLQLENVAAEAMEKYRDWQAEREAKIRSVSEQRQLILERYSDVATHLARTYPIKTSSGFLVPMHVYHKIAMECDGDEDQCIQRLYAWADNAGAAEGYEEEGEEEEDEGEEKQIEGEDAVEGEYAVACKGAEQSDLFTDAEEVEDEEEDAKKMLHVNAAFFVVF